MTNTPTPEAVAETVEKLHDRCGPAQYDPLAARAAAMIEALAADRDAQKARADAAEVITAAMGDELEKVRARADAAEAALAAEKAKVARLVEAATTLHRSMELFFEADEAADESERDGCQKEAARLRNMANGRWQSVPGNLDALDAALRGVEGQP